MAYACSESINIAANSQPASNNPARVPGSGGGGGGGGGAGGGAGVLSGAGWGSRLGGK